MAGGKKTADAQETPSLPCLVLSRPEAASRIEDRIRIGHEICEMEIRTEEALEKARAEYEKWHEYNIELLQRLFNNASIADKYSHYYVGGLIVTSDTPSPTLAEEMQGLRAEVKKYIGRLESILGRLELIPECNSVSEASEQRADRPQESGRNVFVVHGHDEASKQMVCRFLERLHLNPIVLHERSDEGRTIIEKFEDYSDQVGFAIILLTPDDEGRKRREDTALQPRARQNVVFEHGYFIGKLTRSRVCALYKADVELPSDLSGVLYVEMDTSAGWQQKLAREVKQAGIEIDFNLLVS